MKNKLEKDQHRSGANEKSRWRITEQRKTLTVCSVSSGPTSPKEILALHKEKHLEKYGSRDGLPHHDKFEEIGLIHKVIAQFVVCDHIGCSSAYHIIQLCKVCKKAEEKHVPYELVAPILSFVEDKHDFMSSQHSFCLEGYCKKCK